MPVRVYLGGRVRLEGGGVVVDERSLPGRQGRLALAFLVVERRRSVPRDELADVLWAGSPPPSREVALSAIVSRLRSAKGRVGLDGARSLPTAFGCHQLQLPADAWVDLEVAHDALHRAEQGRRAGEVADARNWATTWPPTSSAGRSYPARRNRGEALRVYERRRRTLAEELGISPSPETGTLYLEILRA